MTVRIQRRLTKLEAHMTAQDRRSQDERILFQRALAEAQVSLPHPMWDWVLSTAEEPTTNEGMFARIIGFTYGWRLAHSYPDRVPFWLFFSSVHPGRLERNALLYLMRCTQAEFGSLSQPVQEDVLAKAGTEVSAVLRTADSRRLPYSPEESRHYYERLQGLGLPRLLKSHLVTHHSHKTGSQAALKHWLFSQLSPA